MYVCIYSFYANLYVIDLHDNFLHMSRGLAPCNLNYLLYLVVYTYVHTQVWNSEYPSESRILELQSWIYRWLCLVKYKRKKFASSCSILNLWLKKNLWATFAPINYSPEQQKLKCLSTNTKKSDSDTLGHNTKPCIDTVALSWYIHCWERKVSIWQVDGTPRLTLTVPQRA